MAVLKKQYFDVKLELLNSIVPLLAFKPEQLEGRTIKLDLTKLLKGKGAEGKFIVEKKEDNFEAKIFSFRLYPTYIKRLIGHKISIVEDSFVCRAKDIEVRVKPFLITRKRVHRSVRKALRNAAREFLEKNIASKPRDKLFQAVFISLIQKAMSAKLKKIYPLAVCEIRVLKVEKPRDLIKK